MGIGNYSSAPAGTTRVKLEIYGGVYEVDSDQVKMHLKKDAAVKLAMSLEGDKSFEARQQVNKAMGYIIRVNRKIRRTVTRIDSVSKTLEG